MKPGDIVKAYWQKNLHFFLVLKTHGNYKDIIITDLIRGDGKIILGCNIRKIEMIYRYCENHS